MQTTYEPFGVVELGGGRKLDAEWRDVSATSLDGQEWRVRAREELEPRLSFRVSLSLRDVPGGERLSPSEPLRRAIAQAIRHAVAARVGSGGRVEDIDHDHSVSLTVEDLRSAGLAT